MVFRNYRQRLAQIRFAHTKSDLRTSLRSHKIS